MWFATTVGATVSYEDETSTLKITGPTDMAQVVEAVNVLREEDVKYVIMWGPGGEFLPALSLGNMLEREEGVIVTVPADKACISACAFAALGADHIRIDGKLMMHKPFIMGIRLTSTMEEAFTYMGKGYMKMVYYLEDHGYRRSLAYSLMDSTTTCKFMVYTDLVVREPEDLKGWVLEDRCMSFQMFRR